MQKEGSDRRPEARFGAAHDSHRGMLPISQPWAPFQKVKSEDITVGVDRM